MKVTWTHRRKMAYISILGLFVVTLGATLGSLSDTAVGALALAFTGVITNYFASTTYDDHSERKNK